MVNIQHSVLYMHKFVCLCVEMVCVHFFQPNIFYIEKTV